MGRRRRAVWRLLNVLNLSGSENEYKIKEELKGNPGDFLKKKSETKKENLRKRISFRTNNV